MNDLRDRLQHLADDATEGVTLHHPRHLPAGRRSLRTWIAGLCATLLAAIGALGAGSLVLHPANEGTDVRTVTSAVPTTAPTVVDEEPGATDVEEPPGDDPMVDGEPDAADEQADDSPSPAPPNPSAPATPRVLGPSAIVARWGEKGPTMPVAPNDGTAGTAGSGCSPGPGRLPDGVWMAEVNRFATSEIDIDLVCFKTSRSAEASGNPIEHDDEMTNDNAVVRTLPLAPEATFHLQTAPPFRVAGTPTETRAFTDPAAAARFAVESGDATPLAWVLVEGGRVVEVFSPPLDSA
jgi:hypothetical protein